MSQPLSNTLVHLVFSTKQRRPLLRDAERERIHAYLVGVLNNCGSPVLEINSVRDHVHILIRQSKNHAPASVIEQLKAASSGVDQNSCTVVTFLRGRAWE